MSLLVIDPFSNGIVSIPQSLAIIADALLKVLYFRKLLHRLLSYFLDTLDLLTAPVIPPRVFLEDQI